MNIPNTNIPDTEYKAIDLINDICRHYDIGIILVETSDIERATDTEEFLSLKKVNIKRIKSKTVDYLMEEFEESITSAIIDEQKNLTRIESADGN